MKILTRSSLRFNIYADGYSFLFPEGVNCEEQGNGSETALLRGCAPTLWASLFFLFWVTNKTKQKYIYIYIYMENLTTYHLLLNYLTKQPFCQSISENTSILELDIAHVEFCLELDISNIKFQKHGYFVIYFENMTILLYT